MPVDDVVQLGQHEHRSASQTEKYDERHHGKQSRGDDGDSARLRWRGLAASRTGLRADGNFYTAFGALVWHELHSSLNLTKKFQCKLHWLDRTMLPFWTCFLKAIPVSQGVAIGIYRSPIQKDC
jgi:hypothetical protein